MKRSRFPQRPSNTTPFVDKDGVEGGDPGTNRRPHDHHRDYLD